MTCPIKPFIVLSHNVFWFQGVPFDTDTPSAPLPEIMEQLCTMYKKIGPDVICLQEVQDRETFEAVSERLGMAGCYCPGQELPQYGGAVFWQAGQGKPVTVSAGPGNPPQRMRQVVDVTAGTGTHRICNIHLPSARQLGPQRAGARRIEELEDILNAGETGPDIIAGDLNEQPGGPIGPCLEGEGYADTAILATRGDVPTSIGSGRGDYIWIKKDTFGAPAYNVAEKQDLACSIGDKQYLSGHLPLWITLEQP